VRFVQDGVVLAETDSAGFTIESLRPERPLFSLETEGVRVSPEQRRHGDVRRIGCFVRRIAWIDADGEHELDLSLPAAVPLRPYTLSYDRFRLPFNRSVVRFADAFIVHSSYVKTQILRERNATTAIGVLHHGAEQRWRSTDRRDERRRLGLPPEWRDSFLVTSFGGVQRHKRVDKALEARALARQRGADVRLVLAGSLDSGEFDPRTAVPRLGIDDAVHFTGYVDEQVGWDWLHASDVALNLRGPSSGGTSGGIFQAFSMRRPVIASDACEQRELPDDCTVKVPLDESEVSNLAEAMIALSQDPSRCRALEEAVERFVLTECHWGKVAHRYAEYLDAFPRPRVTRRKLVAMKLALQR
jgi:glycosyltransferase involved in cell wall biosynthesis